MGETLRQPDLAKTLIAIRNEGASGFYDGPVAAMIEAEMKKGGVSSPAKTSRPTAPSSANPSAEPIRVMRSSPCRHPRQAACM